MPQMAPMMWFMLFVYFVVLFILYIVLMYFLFVPSVVTSTAASFRKSEFMCWSW